MGGLTGLHPVLGFSASGEARGLSRGGLYLRAADGLPRARKGAGTVHHVVWAIAGDADDFWLARLARLAEAQLELAEVADRSYFRFRA